MNAPQLAAGFFTDKSLSDLAADLSAWALPNQFNDNNPQLASTQLQEYVAKTIKQCDFSTSFSLMPCSAGNPCHNPDFQNIVCNVLLDENWNGILAINCPVPLDELPTQLQGLAAGIDPAQFYGHHVGINITPVNLAQNGSRQNGGRIQGSLETKPSSIFGLIYYDDPAEIPIASGTYEFKVNTLQVLFENSKITSFASKIELQVNELFQEGSSIGDSDVANNIWFNGVYQNHNGEPSYTFRTTEQYVFTIDSQVLDTVTLTQGQFVTEAADSDESTLSNFAFTGSINFKSLEGFDLFSFIDLDISNLIIEMLYTPNGDPERLFVFDASNLTLDMAQSEARPKSLYQNFPLEMKSFVQADAGTTPVDLGFMSVTSPLQQGMPSYPWYGLEFTLGLGSLGGLAEQADFVASMIAAWNPTYDGTYSVFTGLKIPGFSGSKKELSLEGPLNLKIQNLQFYAGEIDCGDGNPVINYVLRLQAIKLSFFSVTMPPSGRTDFLLFGDPCSGKKSDMLGWYAVYDKGVEKKSNGKKTSFGVHEVPPELVHDSLLLQAWRKD